MALAEEQIENASTTDLVKEAVEDARQLVRIEVALAKDEVRTEIKEVKRSALAFGLAAFAALMALATLLSVVVVAAGWVAGLIIGGALMIVGAVVGLTGYKLLPKKPLEATRKRVEKDMNSLKEHIA
jgi:uncharacterized membrane protein YqjE